MDFYQDREFKAFDYIYKRLDDLYHAIALKIGISDAAFLVLYSIAESGTGCQQKDIAYQYAISRQTVNSASKKLAEQGYIQLIPGKGRNMLLTFTETGKAFAQKNILPVIDMENAAFNALTSTEQKELLRLAEKYVTAFTHATKAFLHQE
ncbi:MAG: MarR family transcriptional regulator [Peptococcaceae bacterium]|jgi:DNA-binding MarR family transcriptional regulator|nr:MarR family transcriptional regulator [Peptococcaceae bacterium]